MNTIGRPERATQNRVITLFAMNNPNDGVAVITDRIKS